MFSVFKTGSPVAQNDDLGFVILLPLSSEGWDSRHVLPCQVYVVLCVCVWGGIPGLCPWSTGVSRSNPITTNLWLPCDPAGSLPKKGNVWRTGGLF